MADKNKEKQEVVEEEIVYRDFQTCLTYLQSILNQVSPRFTKFYLESIESEKHYL